MIQKKQIRNKRLGSHNTCGFSLQPLSSARKIVHPFCLKILIMISNDWSTIIITFHTFHPVLIVLIEHLQKVLFYNVVLPQTGKILWSWTPPSIYRFILYMLCFMCCKMTIFLFWFKFTWHMRHLILMEKNEKLNMAIIEQTITCFGVTPFTNFALIKGYPWTSYRSIQLSSIQPDTGHWWLGPLQTFWINKGEHKMN